MRWPGLSRQKTGLFKVDSGEWGWGALRRGVSVANVATQRPPPREIAHGPQPAAWYTSHGVRHSRL